MTRLVVPMLALLMTATGAQAIDASNQECEQFLNTNIDAVCASVFTQNSVTSSSNCNPTPGAGFECRRFYHAWSASATLGGLRMIMEGTHVSDANIELLPGTLGVAFHSDDTQTFITHSTTDPYCTWARTDATNVHHGHQVRPVALAGSASVCGQS